MWREVGLSPVTACTGDQITDVVDWATAKLLVQAQVLSQQDDQCGAVKARQ